MKKSMRSKFGRIAPILPAVLSAGLFLDVPRGARGQDDWTGAVSNQWNDAGNWTAGIPNGVATSVSITNATNNPVLISGISPTIGGSVALTLGATNSLTLGDNLSLTITPATTVNNAGTILLNSAGNLTDLILNGSSGTVTMTGGGILQMSNQGANRIYSTTGATLLNDINNTIQGAGQIGAGQNFGLTNLGTVDANVSNALTISAGQTTINTGLFESTAGGTLNLQTAVNNTGGTILSTGAGSVVNLNTSITGGTLTTTGGGTMFGGNSTLSGLTISAGSTLTVQDNSVANLAGTITNNGTIALKSAGNLTDLAIGSGTVTNTGGGLITLSNQPANRIYSTTGGTLVNDTANTIQGAGQIGAGLNFALNNKGTIDANVSNALSINAGQTVINTNLLEATVGGTLNLQTAVNNTGGTILSTGGGSTVNLAGSTITGGTLTTTGGGTMLGGNSTLSGLTISTGTTLTLEDNTTTNLAGTLTINGAILLNSAGNTTDLVIGSGTVTNTGGGSITMSNQPANRIYSTTGGTLVNDTANTIQGSGQIGAGQNFIFDNKGTVNANVSNPLFINAGPPVNNTNLLEASAGGTLNLQTAVNNAGTILSTGAGSTVNLAGSTITGGTLTTTGGGTMLVGSSTLSGLTISTGSTVTQQDNTTTNLAGTITNNGTYLLKSAGNTTDLIIGSGTVTNTGGGSITMSNQGANRIYSTSGGTLLNDTTNTIQGAGQIGAGQNFTLNNKGTVDANVSNAITINAVQPVINTHLLEATAGGTLNLQTAVNNAGGTVLSTGGGSVVNVTGTITNGTLTTAGGATMFVGNSTLSNLTISSGSTVTAQDNTSTTLVGTITNNGTIAQNSAGNTTDIQLNGNVTLAGTGALVMSNQGANRIYSSVGSQLTNGPTHTIEGAGQLGVGLTTMVNNGTILANLSNALNVVPNGGGVTNNGTFQSNSGSTLFVNGTLNNYNPTSSTLTGGTYNAFSGTIELSQASAGGGQVIATNSATVLLDGASAKIADGSGNDVVRGFLTSNTAAGSFTIQNGANLTTAASGFTNTGTVNIGASSTFTVGGSQDYIQTGGLTNLMSASSFLAVASGQSVRVTGGTLEGQGTIQGNLVDGGTVHPGESPGILTVSGNDTQDASGHLAIDIGGPNPGTGFSQLNVSGTASLDGTLDLSLINGFTPFNGEKFVILTSGGLSGTFSNETGLNEGSVTFTVTYSPPGFANDVVLDAAVPEPASLAMLVLGLAGIAGRTAGRSRRIRGK